MDSESPERSVLREDEQEESIPEPVQWWQNPHQVVAMISNFSTSYNVVNISLVIPILEDLYGTSPDSAAECASSLLAGMVMGQLIGGVLGDTFLGRLGALRVVMALQIIASVGSACVSQEHIYTGLSVWRFVLGIGAGGVYPLAATLSAENASTAKEDSSAAEEKEQQLKNVALTFSMQGVGFLAVPVVTIPLLFAVSRSSLDLVWRIILGLGSLPGIVLLLLQTRLYRSQSSAEPLPQSEEEASHRSTQVSGTPDEGVLELAEEEEEVLEGIDIEPTSGVWAAIRKEERIIPKLLGTAGAWFLFDVLFYGNTLFEPIVMEAAFGNKTSEENLLRKAAIDSLLLGLIALPGYVVAAVVMGKRLCYILQDPRNVQRQGFFMMAILYAIIGSYWSFLRTIPALLVTVYGMTFFFANYGPNTTTFILPSLMFSEECRSTLNGISAASGKAGALLGATLFEPAAESLGSDRVMLICGAISLVALMMTQLFVHLPPVLPEPRIERV